MFTPQMRVNLLAFGVLMTSMFGLQAAMPEGENAGGQCGRCNKRSNPVKNERAVYKEMAEIAANTRQILAASGARREDVVKTLNSRALCSSSESVFFAKPLHTVLEVAPYGDLLTIEDGSAWTINGKDREIVKSWDLNSPLITFTPNSLSLWAKLTRKELMYKYCIVNLKTGASVQANLALGPFVQNPNTLRIRRFDKKSGELAFTNGSVWQLDTSKLSAKIYNDWRNGDYVITGSNNTWFGLKDQNIIINVSADNWLPAQRLF
jgi:hypothetical protein